MYLTDYEDLNNIQIYVGLLLETQLLTASQRSHLEAMFKMNPYTIQDELEKFSSQLGIPKAKIIDWQKNRMLYGKYKGTHLIDKYSCCLVCIPICVYIRTLYVQTMHSLHENISQGDTLHIFYCTHQYMHAVLKNKSGKIR